MIMESKKISLVEDSWQLKIRRMYIYADKIPEVYSRLERMNSEENQGKGESFLCDYSNLEVQYCPYLVPFREIKVSPMFLTIHVSPEISEKIQLDPPSCFCELSLPMREEDARDCLRCLLVAVSELHSRCIVHGYISPATVRQNRKSPNRFLLINHLLPIHLFIPSTPISTLLRYCLAPEIEASEPYSYAADVWALGALLIHLTISPSKIPPVPQEQLNAGKGSGRGYPLRALETADLVNTDILSPYISSLSSSATSFVVQCLKEDPEKRPSVAELLTHPFISSEQILFNTESEQDDRRSSVEDEDPETQEEEKESEDIESSDSEN